MSTKNKSLYYIECTCIKDVVFPNVKFHVGDILYYNSNAAANEMYIFNRYVSTESEISNNALKYFSINKGSYLPFTRKKINAKKWQLRSYADWTANFINLIGDFNAVVKEVKITYTEEE